MLQFENIQKYYNSFLAIDIPSLFIAPGIWLTIVNFIQVAAMYVVLMLPESLLLWNGFHLHFHLHDYPQLLLMIIVLFCIFHVTLLLEDTEMEQFLKTVFAIIAACFFILLYNPGLILPAFISTISYALFSSYYYDFEKKYNKVNSE